MPQSASPDRGSPSRSAELLSPVGDRTCLRAAIENGADAVYFGLECGFNARARAANLHLEDLPEIMAELHARAVRGYVTLNTLVFSEELAAIERTVIELTEAPDPARCCEAFAGLPYRLFLDSATPGTRLGRYSFVTADPVAVVQSKGARTEIRSRNGVRTVEGDVLVHVGALLYPHRHPALDGLPPFQGGAAAGA